MDICALKQIISMLQYPISQIPSHLCRADGLCIKKKKKRQPVIICAINGAGYVPVEGLQMAR